MTYFSGKAVVITGAASGIGRALAQQAAQAGAHLLLADIQATALEALAGQLRASGATCHTLVTDTGQEAAVQALAEESRRVFSTGADVLINNAGVSLVVPVQNMQTTDAQWLMNINFWGVVHGCRLFLPQMRSRPEAVLVNISSIFAMVSMPTQSMYNASKAAVRGFSDALREELRGTAVRVLCVHPGGIRTNIARDGRKLDVSLIADNPQTMVDQFEARARTSPEQAAAVILAAIASGKTRVLIGADAKLLDGLFRLFPTRVSPWFATLVEKMRNRATG